MAVSVLIGRRIGERNGLPYSNIVKTGIIGLKILGGDGWHSGRR